jgi:hypothetical protein
MARSQIISQCRSFGDRSSETGANMVCRVLAPRCAAASPPHLWYLPVPEVGN